MVKNLLKKLFLIFGILMFAIGIRYFNDIDHALLIVLGMISIALGWKYPDSKQKV